MGRVGSGTRSCCDPGLLVQEVTRTASEGLDGGPGVLSRYQNSKYQVSTGFGWKGFPRLEARGQGLPRRSRGTASWVRAWELQEG